MNVFQNHGWIGGLINARAFGDLWVIKNHIPFLIEVKNEDRYSESPNVCIEIYQGQNRKPSGLSICESTVVIHTFGAEAYLYRTQWMRLYVRNLKSSIGRFAASDNHNLGILIEKQMLRDLWFCDRQIINEIPESKIFSVRISDGN